MVIEVTDLKIGAGKSSATQEVYFSGGLRGFPSNRGWVLHPVSEDPNSDALAFQNSQDHFHFATRECGQKFIGTCVRYLLDTDGPPMDVWESGKRDPSNNLNAADSWSAVKYHAASANDNIYANCAASLSVCLKVAGLRLRDLSREYHDQLRWALLARAKTGAWFSNAALLELYADCHSLVSELSSARDHLAKVAAIHVDAPDNIDSLARLDAWINKNNRRADTSQPIASLILSAYGTEANPGWLRRLGELRNEMLHRLPMGANERVSALTLQQVNTSLGPVKTIRLGEPPGKTELDDQGIDPLIELSELSNKMEQLCREGWKLAKYPSSLPQVVARGSK